MKFTRIDYRYGVGTVKYHLTITELFQIIKANIKAIFIGGCPADHMSMALENLLCGFDGSRHRVIRKPDVDDNIHRTSK